jgi:hypothetical protein
MQGFDEETQRILTYVGTALLAFAGAIWKLRLWARRDLRDDHTAEADAKLHREASEAHSDLVGSMRTELERLASVVSEQGRLIASLQNDLYSERTLRWESERQRAELQVRVGQLEGLIRSMEGGGVKK